MMQTYQAWIVARSLLLAPLLSHAETAALQPAETKQARDARMAWWREARFGMFVHWGIYSGLNESWGFNAHAHAWRSSKELIRILVDIASKGGNLLLNVGPSGEGEIPQENFIRNPRVFGVRD